MASVDDVAQEQNDNKLAALQAMAAGTSDPYNAQQQQLRDSQGQALTNMALSATGAPAGLGDELAPIISGPGDAAIAALSSQSDPYAADLSAIQSTGVPYASSAPSASSLNRKTVAASEFPVQYYGPYARYGGFGSQSEEDDAILGLARQAAQHEAQTSATARGQLGAGMAQEAAGSVAAAATAAAAMQAAAGGQHGSGWTLGGGRAPSGAVLGPAQAPVSHGWFAPPQGGSAPFSALGLGTGGPPNLPHTLQGGIAAGLDATEHAAVDPLNLYKFAQQEAIGHDIVPALARGHFTPEWAMKIALEDLAGPNNYVQARNEYGERSANGGMTDAEMHAKQVADDALAQAAIKSSGEYQAGQAAIAGILQRQADGSQNPMSADGLRITLVKQGLPADVIVQLLRDYGGAFVGGAAANSIDPNGLQQINTAQQQPTVGG